MATIGSSLLIMNPLDVAFTQLAINEMSQVYCEASYTGAYRL